MSNDNNKGGFVAPPDADIEDREKSSDTPVIDLGLSDIPCEVRMSLEQYEGYRALATLMHSRVVIPEATLPALVDFLLAEWGKAVTTYVCEVVEDFYAFAESLLGEEDE